MANGLKEVVEKWRQDAQHDDHHPDGRHHQDGQGKARAAARHGGGANEVASKDELEALRSKVEGTVGVGLQRLRKSKT